MHCKLTTIPQEDVMRDIKLLQSIRVQLRDSILVSQSAVSKAADGESRIFTPWQFTHEDWANTQTVRADGILEQSVDFDLIEGSLLADGQALGQLPEEYTKQDFFQEFFGNRVFSTYPSSAPGMAYMLASPFEHHMIYFGFRSGDPIMRARSSKNLFEFVPQRVFPGDRT